jgi:hypothetical protein
MIQELTESVDQLRDEAQAARKAARQLADPAKREQLFASAREKFESAIRRLERGLRNVRRDQKEHSSDACAVLERLSQTYGSLGGTLRDFALTKADQERQKMLAEARSQYEQGNTYEDERRKHCGALDTYNMLQLLVVELLGNAALINDHEFETKLQGVQKELERQVNAGRNDSWALADLALVSFLLGSPADHALADIEQRNVHASFYETTHTVITNLLNEGLGSGGDLTKRLEEFQRLLKRKGGLA